MEWQSSIQDTQIIKNNHNYIGPHKHIVCLVGSCEFSINQFVNEFGDKMKKQPNLSLSILGLSSDEMTEHIEAYSDMCKQTSEGVFVNITDRNCCENLISQFRTSLDVYESKKMSLITELF